MAVMCIRVSAAIYGHLSTSLDFARVCAQTIRSVTRAATVIGEYPHPLAYLLDGIVLQAVCGFRQARRCLGRSGSTLRYPAGHRYTGFRDRDLAGMLE
jgi:hypothetical protein